MFLTILKIIIILICNTHLNSALMPDAAIVPHLITKKLSILIIYRDHGFGKKNKLNFKEGK